MEENEKPIQVILNKGIPENVIILPKGDSQKNMIQLINESKNQKVIGFKKQTLVEMFSLNVQNSNAQNSNLAENNQTINLLITANKNNEYSIAFSTDSENHYKRKKLLELIKYIKTIGEVTSQQEYLKNEGEKNETYEVRLNLNLELSDNKKPIKFTNTIESLVEKKTHL